MAPCLEDCPNEIIESIVVLLEFSDICSLRLSCRTLAAKATQNHFRSFYISKHVDVTEPALQEFCNATQAGRLGCLIQNLVLVGVVDETVQQDFQTNAKTLTAALSNLVAHSPTGKLASLSLEVVVAQAEPRERLAPAKGGSRSTQPIWRSAALTFHVAFASLAASQLPIENLNLFNKQWLRSCSIACDELGKIDFKDKGLITSLAGLSSLSISMSNSLTGVLESLCSDDTTNSTLTSADGGDTVGLQGLLQLCSQIKDFELHYFRLFNGTISLQGSGMEHARLFQAATHFDQLPTLKRCTLRGVWVTEEDLLVYLQRTAPSCLLMEGVAMCSGTFRPIFDYCSSKAAGLEALYLGDLGEGSHGSRTVYFDCPGTVDRITPSWAGGDARSAITLERTGSEVKTPITYHYPVGRTMDSPWSRAYRRERHREFGPLDVDG